MALLGEGAAFAIDAASFLLSAASLAALRIVDLVERPSPGSLLDELRGGWAEFSGRTWLCAGVLHISFLNAFSLVAFFTLGPAIAERSLGGPQAWGLVGAGFAAGTVVGGLVAARWRPRRPLLVAFAAVVAAAPQLAALAVPAPAWGVVAASVLGGAQATFWGATWATTVQRHVPRAALSRVASYQSLGALVLTPLGIAVVGPIAEAVGTGPVMWAGAGWVVTSTVALLLAVPALRASEDGAVRTGAAVPLTTASLLARRAR